MSMDVARQRGGDFADIQGVLKDDLYSQAAPKVDGVKQVLDSLANKIQALSPEQLRVIGYLEFLQARKIHGGKKVYADLIKRIKDEAPTVAPPGFFIRVIEALIPRPMYVDGKSFERIMAERDGN